MKAEQTALLSTAFQRHTWGWKDAVLWACIAAVPFVAGSYLALGTQVLIMILFALSLDLALGYGGVETLGHAAFFGMGGYAAALFALHVTPDPLLGLGVAALAAAVVGLLSGFLVLRCRGLTQVMLTLALASLLAELANAWKSLTKGDDGLAFPVAPVLGVFEFDLAGRTGYWYAAAVLAVMFVLARTLMNAPFGLTIRGIRANPVRMRTLGVPVMSRLIVLYTLAGAMAGVAGALSAQVTKLVALDSLAFALSGNVLVMLILGGAGRLYGAFLGAAVFVVLADRAAAIDPFHWLFVLGVVLILAVRYAPQGLLGAAEKLLERKNQ